MPAAAPLGTFGLIPGVPRVPITDPRMSRSKSDGG
jgi:hypothetical protein